MKLRWQILEKLVILDEAFPQRKLQSMQISMHLALSTFFASLGNTYGSNKWNDTQFFDANDFKSDLHSGTSEGMLCILLHHKVDRIDVHCPFLITKHWLTYRWNPIYKSNMIFLSFVVIL